jgi:hypothetical protein
MRGGSLSSKATLTVFARRSISAFIAGISGSSSA